MWMQMAVHLALPQNPTLGSLVQASLHVCACTSRGNIHESYISRHQPYRAYYKEHESRVHVYKYDGPEAHFLDVGVDRSYV